MSGPGLHEHYFALGLNPGASPEEVRSAYRRLAKLYHPDKDASLDAEVRYRQIRAAYEVLTKNDPSPAPPPPRTRAPAGSGGTQKTRSTIPSGTTWSMARSGAPGVFPFP